MAGTFLVEINFGLFIRLLGLTQMAQAIPTERFAIAIL